MLELIFNKNPELDWIQYEVTSFCNADCIYCPHHAYRAHWQRQHLPMNCFSNLSRAFAKTRLLYLQGWGEPFLHPQFFEMLRLAKQAGCMVGTTTNATVLDTPKMQKLVDERLDVIGFSLAGMDRRNDEIRRGTSFKQTLSAIEALQRIKQTAGSDTPKIHIAYMLLRSGLNDLPRLPDFLSNTGADQTVVSSLSLAVDPALQSEVLLLPTDGGAGQLRERLREFENDCRKIGTDVHLHLVADNRRQFQCHENIARAMVIGCDGSVSPCVFTRFPANGEKLHYFRGHQVRRQNLSFGNVQRESLSKIWKKEAYRRFRRLHLQGKIPSACRNCYKGYIVTQLS